MMEVIRSIFCDADFNCDRLFMGVLTVILWHGMRALMQESYFTKIRILFQWETSHKYTRNSEYSKIQDYNPGFLKSKMYLSLLIPIFT